MSTMETHHRRTTSRLHRTGSSAGNSDSLHGNAMSYGSSLGAELDIIFENIGSLFESIGVITGVVVRMNVNLSHSKNSDRSSRSSVTKILNDSPLSRIFQEQFMVLRGSLERCRAFIVNDFEQLAKVLDYETAMEEALKARLASLEGSIGSLSSHSLDMITPSPPPICSPTVDEISEILSLRDKLLSQLGD